MEIQELINNDGFSFNVPFRIYEYMPPDFDETDEEGETVLKYDSQTDMEFESKLYWQHISAINYSEDGVVEIEYVGEFEF